MIYIVSDKIKKDTEDIKNLSIKESIDIIRGWPVVQFDTETTGLDPHVCKLTSMQLGYKDFKTGECTQIVVDCNSIDPKEYKVLLENSYLIGHNLKFDLQFLYNYGIHPLSVYDTMICEQTLYIGYKPGKVGMSLGKVLYRYTGIELDKSFQQQIASKGLTEEGIRYAANDVVYLQDIRKAQMQTATARECRNAFIVENRFVPTIAYLEWCGVHIDEGKWKVKMAKDKETLLYYKERLKEYVLAHPTLKDAFTEHYLQGDLFSENAYEDKLIINWDSPKQVVKVMHLLGFDTRTIDKKTKKERDSVLEKTIMLQKGIADDFLEIYFGYKGAAKNVSSYGQNYLNLINPITGRLHTVFSQIGTATGRMSSGSSSKNNDLAKLKSMPEDSISFVNLQNLPAREEDGKICRACITPEAGNDFISCDYSAEESRVSADVWNEKSLLDSFAHNIDTHNLYAKLCFPEELKDIDVRDVKQKRPDLRQKAKSAEFAVSYGSDGTAIAASIGMPVEKAKEMVATLLKNLPGMAKFKRQAERFLKKNGFLVINTITGHRVTWPEWGLWKAGQDTQHTYKAWLTKNILNYPIQGGSAVVMKQAAADFYEWIVQNNLFGTVKLCVLVHDEICCECPKSMSGQVTKKLEDIMLKAAGKYYKKLPIPAEGEVGDHWIH